MQIYTKYVGKHKPMNHYQTEINQTYEKLGKTNTNSHKKIQIGQMIEQLTRTRQVNHYKCIMGKLKYCFIYAKQELQDTMY